MSLAAPTLWEYRSRSWSREIDREVRTVFRRLSRGRWRHFSLPNRHWLQPRCVLVPGRGSDYYRQDVASADRKWLLQTGCDYCRQEVIIADRKWLLQTGSDYWREELIIADRKWLLQTESDYCRLEVVIADWKRYAHIAEKTKHGYDRKNVQREDTMWKAYTFIILLYSCPSRVWSFVQRGFISPGDYSKMYYCIIILLVF